MTTEQALCLIKGDKIILATGACSGQVCTIHEIKPFGETKIIVKKPDGFLFEYYPEEIDVLLK